MADIQDAYVEDWPIFIGIGIKCKPTAKGTILCF